MCIIKNKPFHTHKKKHHFQCDIIDISLFMSSILECCFFILIIKKNFISFMHIIKNIPFHAHYKNNVYFMHVKNFPISCALLKISLLTCIIKNISFMRNNKYISLYAHYLKIFAFYAQYCRMLVIF